MSRSVFLLGPGFIGGEVIDLLLTTKYNVTTLVRRESAVAEFAKIGVKTVVGTLDDASVIKNQVAISDIVFHTATADHLPSVEAILDGVRQRTQMGLETIYIHNSGASLIADSSAGEYENETVFDDQNPSQIDSLPDSAPHRLIDLAIVRARRELATHAKMAIMIPPVIYGVTTRENRQIGKGLSVWNHVHVKDLARGYMVLLHWMEGAPHEDVAKNPYFFCENGQELSWGKCAAEIGRILKGAGKIGQCAPKTIPEANYGDLFGGFSGVVAGSNAKNKATRLRQMGWAPLEKDTFASLAEDEIPMILEETGEFNGYASVVAS
ncbi:unnamed protein product [Penicillium bialowiezense]